MIREKLHNIDNEQRRLTCEAGRSVTPQSFGHDKMLNLQSFATWFYDTRFNKTSDSFNHS